MYKSIWTFYISSISQNETLMQFLWSIIMKKKGEIMKNILKMLFTVVLVSIIIGCGGGGSSTTTGDGGDGALAGKSVAINAWIGEYNTEVTLPSEAKGMKLIRSTDHDCDTNSWEGCANSVADVVGDAPIIDTVATLNRQASYWLTNGSGCAKKA
jgi:hypothetical protein